VFQPGVPLRSPPPSAVESKLPAHESFQATWLHLRIRRSGIGAIPIRSNNGVGLCTICLTGGFYSEFAGMFSANRCVPDTNHHQKCVDPTGLVNVQPLFDYQ
jgi:hypothetical protein